MGGFDGWWGAISRLAAVDAYRRRGIGRALHDEVKSRLTADGVKMLGALVEQDHPWAMSYWESAGSELKPRMVLFATQLSG